MINYSNYKIALEKHRYIKNKYKWSNWLVNLYPTTEYYSENYYNMLEYNRSKEQINKWYEKQLLYKKGITVPVVNHYVSPYYGINSCYTGYNPKVVGLTGIDIIEYSPKRKSFITWICELFNFS